MLMNDPDLKHWMMTAAEKPDNDAASSTTTGASTSRRSSKSKRKRAAGKATSVSTDEDLFCDPHAPPAKQRKRRSVRSRCQCISLTPVGRRSQKTTRPPTLRIRPLLATTTMRRCHRHSSEPWEQYRCSAYTHAHAHTHAPVYMSSM